MSRLLVLSSSQRRSTRPEAIPAIDRYEGVYFRIVKKYLREGILRNTDVLVVSEKFGILRADDKVPYHEPFRGYLPQKDLEERRKTNLDKLRAILAQKSYSEIFVACGKDFQKLIDGFQKLTPAKIVFCRGSGLGPKAQELKRWILTN